MNLVSQGNEKPIPSVVVFCSPECVMVRFKLFLIEMLVSLIA